MEYYVYITHNCNTRCSYCCSSRVISSVKCNITSRHIDRIIQYIIENLGEEPDLLMMSGGEPLLRPDIIHEILDKTEGLNLTRMTLTNGILLDRVPLDLLNRFDAILVSMDGDRNSHELHRGRGTYDRIVSNLQNLKHRLKPTIIGRGTLEEESDVFSSVTNMLPITDAVYWQIVSKPRFRKPDPFIASYEQGIEKLVKFWLNGLRQGKHLRIIPFIAIVSSLVFGYKRNGVSFRCGAGWNLQVIDIDGAIYWCDEYIGEPKGVIGNLYGKKPTLIYEPHYEIFKECRSCPVTDICLGRCKKCLKEYTSEHNRIYCRLTRKLIDTLTQHIDEIKSLIEEQGYTLDTFYDVPRCTEEIP